MFIFFFNRYQILLFFSISSMGRIYAIFHSEDIFFEFSGFKIINYALFLQ